MEICNPEKTCQINLINIPDTFQIHHDYLKDMDKHDFDNAFRQIWHIFKDIYADITSNQCEFGIPKKEKLYAWTPYRPVSLLYFLFVAGVVENRILIASIEKFNEIHSQLKNIAVLIDRLHDYGFEFTGLQGYKIPKNAGEISISYPDNPNIIAVIKYMADKAYKFDKRRDFNSCYFRLFTEDMNTSNYDNGIDVFADRLDTQNEKDTAYIIDKALREKGFFAHERHGYSYYAKESVMKAKGAYHFKLEQLEKAVAESVYASSRGLMFPEKSSDKTLILCLRIRDVAKCLEYLEQCPESVKNIFRGSDRGCGFVNNCETGMTFTFEGNEYWRCSCCSAMFHCLPKTEDIPHYVKLVELGFK